MDRRLLILGVGIVALSTAVVFVKLSELPPSFLASMRLLLGALILWPFVGGKIERLPGRRHPLIAALPAALLLGAHFVTWFIGVRETTAANATLIVNLSPVIMPFALLAIVGERVTGREVVGSILAVMGVVVLGADSASIDATSLRGDLICVVGMVLAVLYLVLARRNAGGRGIISYLVPLYAIAGVATLIYSAASGEIAQMLRTTYSWPRELLLMVTLAVVPTAFGHSVLNWAMVHLRGQVVATASLGQVVFAAILAWWALGEVPADSFYLACVFIGLGALVVILKPRKRAEPVEPVVLEVEAAEPAS